MLDSLFTSKMRVQILMRLFLNAHTHTYLRELTREFDASPGHIRNELMQLSKAGLLESVKTGRNTLYQANQAHPLFPELQSMVRKSLGMDRIVESIVQRLGNLQSAYLTGDYAEGRDTGVIDLLLVGDINQDGLLDLVKKTERYIERKIRVFILSHEEFSRLAATTSLQPRLELWCSEVSQANRHKRKRSENMDS